jgi:hypothetical protein
VQTLITHRRAGYLASLGIFFAASVFAQPPASPAETSRPPQWTVAAGFESFWWRDVAMIGPPVTASPIAWKGEGPAVHVSYERGRRSRLHHFEGTFSSAGGFDLRSPVLTTVAPAGDGAWRMGTNYEYRRYFWRDLWMTGFDAGIGVQGGGEHLSFTHHYDPDITLETGLTNLRTAFVIAGRLERWSPWSLAVAWGNGLTFGRSAARHRAETETTLSTWGGGWQSTLEISGDVRVASRARVYAAWLGSGEGRAGNHDTFTFGRSQLTMGVTLGR